IRVNVVSMPSIDRFNMQPAQYRSAVFPPNVPVVSVEAGVTFGWSQFADISVGIDRFGASAPGSTVLKNLGISAENVAAQARVVLGQAK
ncbi:MAG: transketolase-like TK C-terminal-containing protein, partial [Actinomycetes bacterium]